MTVKCVVVATQTSARIFIQKEIGKELQETTSLSCDPAGDTGAVESRRFAREICTFLDNSRSDYDKLILIAPPDFLGILKECLPERVPRLLVNTLNRDVLEGNGNEIRKFLKL